MADIAAGSSLGDLSAKRRRGDSDYLSTTQLQVLYQLRESGQVSSSRYRQLNLLARKGFVRSGDLIDGCISYNLTAKGRQLLQQLDAST